MAAGRSMPGSAARRDPRADVDIVIESKDLATLVDALRERGYDDVPRDDTRAWNFVLGDRDGHEVDFHVIDLEPDGTGTYGPPPPEFIFPADSLTAVTDLCGRKVRRSRPTGSSSSIPATSPMRTTAPMSSPCVSASTSRSRPNIGLDR